MANLSDLLVLPPEVATSDNTQTLTNKTISTGSSWQGNAVTIQYGGTGSTTVSGARTNLGATTLGGNLFTITNPSAIAFPRFNEDNTVSSLSASDFNTAIGLGTTSNVQFGSFGVGTAASGTSGEIRATNNVTAYYSSDARLKENVVDITRATETVCAIGGKLFDWTDNYLQDHGGEDGYFLRKQDFGVIAQDVQQVFPRAVRERSDGTLAVDYEKLSALAFAAIKELVKRIEQLERKT